MGGRGRRAFRETPVVKSALGKVKNRNGQIPLWVWQEIALYGLNKIGIFGFGVREKLQLTIRRQLRRQATCLPKPTTLAILATAGLVHSQIRRVVPDRNRALYHSVNTTRAMSMRHAFGPRSAARLPESI